MINYIPPPATQRDCMSAATKRYKYLRRMFKFDQMDFEFAFWQMLYLFTAPQKVYRNFQYRKQTKSQFARDDPAFLVLFAAWLCSTFLVNYSLIWWHHRFRDIGDCILWKQLWENDSIINDYDLLYYFTSVGFAVVLKLGFLQFIHFLLYTVFVDCIAVGIVVATIFWFVSNKYFRNSNEIQDVEWGYTFDVHLNAYFPPLILLHFFQLFFYNGLIGNEWFLSRLLGNTFWLVAVLYYMYITFLGYNSLEFLKRTHLIISPLPVVIIFYIITLVSGFNITQVLMHFYKYRVV